jgi:hypothetical protein
VGALLLQMGLHVFFGCYHNLFRLMAKCGVLENLLLKVGAAGEPCLGRGFAGVACQAPMSVPSQAPMSVPSQAPMSVPGLGRASARAAAQGSAVHIRAQAYHGRSRPGTLQDHTHTFCNTGGDVRELDFRFFLNGTKIGAPLHGEGAPLHPPYRCSTMQHGAACCPCRRAATAIVSTRSAGAGAQIQRPCSSQAQPLASAQALLP